MTAVLDQSPPARNALGSFADAVLTLLPSAYRRHPVAIGLALFGLYVAIVMAMSWLQPQTDWDIIPYIALSAERSLGDVTAMHAYAYDMLRQSVKPAEFLLLTDDAGGYRSHMFANAADFASMFGMYRVKWLYIELVTQLGALIGPVQAIRLISAVSALAFCGVALAWLRCERALVMAPLLAVFLGLTGFAELARAASPDMLFSALMLAALFAWRRGREIACAVLLVLAFLARPDNAIFLGVFAVLLVVYRQWSLGVLAGFAVCAALFVPLTAATGEPGWWIHVYVSSVEKANSLTGFHPPFSLVLYGMAIAKQFLLAVTAQTWVAVFAALLAGWYATEATGARLDRRVRTLMLACALGIVAKFVLVPIFDTRIYFLYLAVMGLILAGRVAAVRAGAAPDGAPRHTEF